MLLHFGNGFKEIIEYLLNAWEENSVREREIWTSNGYTTNHD
jgi:hypothetical protein